MLCSVCKKNMAVIFVNKLDKEGKATGETTGLCVECAKKQGIDPISNVMKEMENMSEEDLNNMTNQFNSLLGNMSTSENLIDDENELGFPGGLGGLFGFNRNKKEKTESTEQDEDVKDNSSTKGQKVRKTKYLNTFGENLTRKARDGKIDKVIGREIELQRTIQILNRRNKNNPALIGEPGVGKTAIVNALAIAIAEGNVPPKLIDKEVYMVDMTSLVAGTQFRGQFESRIKGIIDECKSFGNIILAIDEVHNIVGGLEHDNSMNAANMLKPALANGTVQLIGATTLKEYRQYIEKDTALERRFQPVLVEEPNRADCLEILKGIKKYYEDYHKVILTDEILGEAVNLSDRYIHDRFLPDKAIDLIDEACSRVNLDDVNLAKIEKLRKELDNIQEEKEELETKLETSDSDTSNQSSDEISNFEKAAKLKAESCRIETEIESLSKKTKPKKVEFDDIAKVVELWTKIPVMRIKTAETTKLLKLKDSLNKKIIGQDNAVAAISNAILRKRSNIRNIIRPPSFIFVGPTGVGKTALVKALAYELFDNENAVIKLDMSEFTESHSVSKLIGAPPGYVGYDEAGQLTEKIRRNPYSIVLFDEIEKAHQSIYNMLLQILDEGKLTDSQGKSVSFKHTIIVLTSNLGTNFRSDNYGFGNKETEKQQLEQKTSEALKEFFTPEFLNRIDDIISFNKLSKANLLEITDLLLKELKKETSEKGIIFDYTDSVRNYIIENGYNDKFGARPLRRAIQKHIEDLIALEYIKGNIKENKKFKIDVVDSKITIV